jgi:hypothetical protein
MDSSRRGGDPMTTSKDRTFENRPGLPFDAQSDFGLFVQGEDKSAATTRKTKTKVYLLCGSPMDTLVDVYQIAYQGIPLVESSLSVARSPAALAYKSHHQRSSDVKLSQIRVFIRTKPNSGTRGLTDVTVFPASMFGTCVNSAWHRRQP